MGDSTQRSNVQSQPHLGVVESHPAGVAEDRRLRHLYAPGIGGGDPHEGMAGKEGVTHPAGAA